jgi:hypothetical protein
MAASPMAETTGATVLGAAAADTRAGQLAGGWLTRYGPRREKVPSPWLPTVPQHLAPAVNQAAELRLCPNPRQLCAHIVILAAQKAANRHK